MKIEGANPETGAEFEADAESVNDDFVKSMFEFEISDEKVKSLIDNLDISADAKAALYAFSKATIRVGEFVLKIGRKIIDFVCLVYSEYPSAIFGIVFGAIAGTLISSIPIIGIVLGPIFTPIAIALGLVKGVIEDLKDKALARRITEINARFSPLDAG